MDLTAGRLSLRALPSGSVDERLRFIPRIFRFFKRASGIDEVDRTLDVELASLSPLFCNTKRRNVWLVSSFPRNPGKSQSGGRG